jgi:hypothetical protein
MCISEMDAYLRPRHRGNQDGLAGRLHSERVVANLARRAQQLGLQLVPLGGGLTTCKNDLSEAQAVTNQINEINYFEGVT